jgi:hypothetical protein
LKPGIWEKRKLKNYLAIKDLGINADIRTEILSDIII